MKTGICLVLVGLTIVAAGCGSDEPPAGQPDSSEPASSRATSTTASTATDPELVGLWQRVNKCPELVGAVEEAGLGPVASSVDLVLAAHGSRRLAMPKADWALPPRS
jgi:hypothetical protein